MKVSATSVQQGGVVVDKLSSILVVGAVLGVVIWLRPAHDLPSMSARQQIQHEVLAADRQPATHAELADLEAELRETGRVLRQRSTLAARDAEQASRDARISAAIEAQLARDPRLSARAIDVTTTEGRVTLAGSVDTSGDVLRAIQLAFAEPDVSQVVSTLQIVRAHARSEQPVLPR
jgi:hypothetical protein